MSRCLRGLAVLGAVAATATFAQEPARNHWGYDFPRALDAEVAAPSVHRVRYEDDHIMLMEVSNPPGYPMQMHGHPYPSIFARSSGRTTLGGSGPRDGYVEPDGGRNGEHWQSAPAPAGTPSLECTAADPQAPHRPVNRGATPQHFYRIEFKRLDDDDATHAGDMPRGDALRTLYEDEVVRLSEVSIRSGGSARLVPASEPAVLAFDTARAFDAVDAGAGTDVGRSLPPTGYAMPRCMTIDAGVSPPLVAKGGTSVHYYRLEFKRIEGDALREHWRVWYPEMTRMR